MPYAVPVFTLAKAGYCSVGAWARVCRLRHLMHLLLRRQGVNRACDAAILAIGLTGPRLEDVPRLVEASLMRARAYRDLERFEVSQAFRPESLQRQRCRRPLDCRGCRKSQMRSAFVDGAKAISVLEALLDRGLGVSTMR